MSPELKNKKTLNSKSKQKKSDIKVPIKKDSADFFEKEVSVITKTTKPQVVIQSEKIDELQKNCMHDWTIWFRNKHQLIKFCCIIVVCIIILLTFFLSLKTYNMVKDLHNIIL